MLQRRGGKRFGPPRRGKQKRLRFDKAKTKLNCHRRRKRDSSRILMNLLGETRLSFTPANGFIQLDAHRRAMTSFESMFRDNRTGEFPPGEEQRIFRSILSRKSMGKYRSRAADFGLAITRPASWNCRVAKFRSVKPSEPKACGLLVHFAEGTHRPIDDAESRSSYAGFRGRS